MLLSLLYFFVNFLEVSTCFVFSCWSSFFYNIVILDFVNNIRLYYFLFLFFITEIIIIIEAEIVSNWHLIKETSRARYFFLQYFFLQYFFFVVVACLFKPPAGPARNKRKRSSMMEVLPSCMYSSLRNLHNKYKNVSFW